MYTELIFVLKDGTELKGKDAITSNIKLFPENILETVKPTFFKYLQMDGGYNKTIIRVFTNGDIVIEDNIVPISPFIFN